MGDKSNIAHEKVKKLQLETTVSRKTIVKKYKKSSKTAKRRNRRRRSKRSYVNMLRKERVSRGTQELCDSIQEFNFIDMDMTPMCDVNKLPEEITEWQKRNQIAYWKSRAISLEIENQMLRQHLRNVYAQQTEFYEKSKNWQEIKNHAVDSSDQRDLQNVDNLAKPSIKNSSSKKKVVEKQIESISEEPDGSKKTDTEKVIPKKPMGKNRLHEMEKIYGDMAPKIMGMETAIELNYQRIFEEGSPVYWPNIPLKL